MITVYTTTRIDSELRVKWFKETLYRFYSCTVGLEGLFRHILIDDSPSPYAAIVEEICAPYPIEMHMDFSRRHRVYYAGIWRHILETCETDLFMFLLDDIFFIQKQDFITPAIKAFEQHNDLYKIQLQCLFSSWTKAGGSPIYGARRFYQIEEGFVQAIEGTRLYRHPIDAENTLWKTKLGEYRGVAEKFSLNPSILRKDILRRYRVPSPGRLFFSPIEEKLTRRIYRYAKRPLIVSPSQVEIFFYGTDIDRKYNSGYLNMQTFSYTPDHQPTGIEDVEEFKRINCARLLELPGRGRAEPVEKEIS